MIPLFGLAIGVFKAVVSLATDDAELVLCLAHRGVTGRADVDCCEVRSVAVTCIPRTEDVCSYPGIGVGTIRGLDFAVERCEMEPKVE